MTLRPRYSLLTLLVLTALVAGGVKLWHGPHHVVERIGDFDTEYSYTRDWRGNKTVEGPVFARSYQNGILEGFTLHYFQNGEDSMWIYECRRVKKGAGQPEPATPSNEDCPLSEQERKVFYQARDEELRRIKSAGLGSDLQYEGLSEFDYKMPLKP